MYFEMSHKEEWAAIGGTNFNKYFKYSELYCCEQFCKNESASLLCYVFVLYIHNFLVLS